MNSFFKMVPTAVQDTLSLDKFHDSESIILQDQEYFTGNLWFQGEILTKISVLML